ncbi:portal protein [Vibrio breoganii]|uniref:Portal protein n=1 Tax=Vibrio breoganii TaxID=553239 RepID=A0AAP8MVY6_9VIBR|nr:portal protein [Vibrio breoganii]PMP10222.1 portal protein [Vibrio breoganii]
MIDSENPKLLELQDLMSDIDAQPDWRTSANKACSYYDGDQLPKDVVDKLNERGQPATVHNLVAPAVDGVLGMEAKTRTDLLVKADDPSEEFEQIAEAINSEFADACRLGRMDRARSEAYANQLKAGVGFVEAYRNPNLFGVKYKIKHVPRDEVYWDWFSKEPDFSDCRWVMRCRWIDVDELKTLVPNKADILKHMQGQWETFKDLSNVEGMPADLMSAYADFTGWTREQSEWLSENRKRVRLQIIYKREIKQKAVLQLNNGRTVLFNEKSQEHQMAVIMGKAKLTKGQVSEIKETWFAGPHHLGERPCTAPNGMFPLVPFWGYRKDANGEPYGLVSRAIPAQDEVNFRRMKLTWLLQAKRVIMDEDATNMSRDAVIEEVERPDGHITLNPDRRNHKSISEAFQVQQDFNIASQQFQVMQDSMQMIQDTMGIYGAFLGQESNATSGVAIANLVEQGATTLAEINDNYRLGCQLVGELLLGYIIEDMKGRENYAVQISDESKGSHKQVVLNEVDETGNINNDVTRMRSHIALAPIQQTHAYKSQLADRMMQVTAQLPPEVQVATIDMVLELSDVPNKAEFISRVRDALGVAKDPEDMTPEEQQQLQQQQAEQQQQKELAMREVLARVSKLEAEAQAKMAEMDKVQAEVQNKGANTGKTQAEMALLLQQLEAQQAELQGVRLQLAEQLQKEIDAIDL